MNAPTSPLTAELEAALQWWQAAGVDCAFSDDATDWLADPVKLGDQGPGAKGASDTPSKGQRGSETTQGSESASATNSIARLDLMGESPPQDLAAFQQFWMEAPGLDAIGPRGRIAPRGTENAELMVIVIDPEERDRDQLLSGPQGRLLANALTAMGLSEDKVYFASALPRHTPMADTASIAAGGMDAVVARHIELVAPKRVLAFGTNISPLLGHAITKDIQSLREINQNSRKVPLLVNEGLDSLMAMPRLKARFWRRWIEWSAD